MSNTKIGIVGFGIIGKAVYKMFANSNVKTYIHDPVTPANIVPKTFFCASADYAKAFMDECDVVFVCVPTPHNKYDGLDMSIIEDVVSKFDPKIFVICSALQPGTADRLANKYSKNIVVPHARPLKKRHRDPKEAIQDHRIVFRSASPENQSERELRRKSVYSATANHGVRVRARRMKAPEPVLQAPFPAVSQGPVRL